MSFLLDTCVLSHGSKRDRDEGVEFWLRHTPDENKHVSVISLGEIQFGIGCLPPGRKRSELMAWYRQIVRPAMAGRVLPFDESVAERWAEMRVRYRDASILDCQIAATAFVHGFTIVTRNVKDFAFEGLAVFNPWRR